MQPKPKKSILKQKLTEADKKILEPETAPTFTPKIKLEEPQVSVQETPNVEPMPKRTFDFTDTQSKETKIYRKFKEMVDDMTTEKAIQIRDFAETSDQGLFYQGEEMYEEIANALGLDMDDEGDMLKLEEFWNILFSEVTDKDEFDEEDKDKEDEDKEDEDKGMLEQFFSELPEEQLYGYIASSDSLYLDGYEILKELGYDEDTLAEAEEDGIYEDIVQEELTMPLASFLEKNKKQIIKKLKKALPGEDDMIEEVIEDFLDEYI